MASPTPSSPPKSHTPFPMLPVVAAAAAGAGAGVALLLVLLFFWFRRRRRIARSVPLPPVQPLAYQREKYGEAATSRPATVYDVYEKRSLYSFWSGFSSSSQKRLAHQPSNSSSTSRGTLRTADYSTAQPSSSAVTLSPEPFSSSTPTPNVPYVNRPPPRSTSSLATVSEPDLNRSGSGSGSSENSRSRSRSPFTRRPNGSVSSDGTRLSAAESTPRPRPLGRGAPHRPYSQIEIVLPAPLAPSLGSEPFERPPSRSTIDTWTPAVSRVVGPNQPSAIRGRLSKANPGPYSQRLAKSASNPSINAKRAPNRLSRNGPPRSSSMSSLKAPSFEIVTPPPPPPVPAPVSRAVIDPRATPPIPPVPPIPQAYSVNQGYPAPILPPPLAFNPSFSPIPENRSNQPSPSPQPPFIANQPFPPRQNTFMMSGFTPRPVNPPGLPPPPNYPASRVYNYPLPPSAPIVTNNSLPSYQGSQRAPALDGASSVKVDQNRVAMLKNGIYSGLNRNGSGSSLSSSGSSNRLLEDPLSEKQNRQSRVLKKSLSSRTLTVVS